MDIFPSVVDAVFVGTTARQLTVIAFAITFATAYTVSFLVDIPATATDDTQVVFATAKEFCALAIVVTTLYTVFVVAMATENTSCIVTTAIESRARTTAFYAVTSTGAIFVITTACADTVYIGTTAR